MAATTGSQRGWALKSVPFLVNGVVGTMVMDTGAEVTAVSSSFVSRAGLKIRPHNGTKFVKLANGAREESTGVVDLKLRVQLMLDVGDGQHVHWNRQIALQGVWVLPVGQTTAPADLFVSWADWRFSGGDGEPPTPLGSLAYMVLHGATVLASPRAPRTGTEVHEEMKVVLERHSAPPLASVSVSPESDDLRLRITEQIPAKYRGSMWAEVLTEELLKRAKVFGPINTDDCTEIVDFDIIGEPEQVSFKVPISRRGAGEAALVGLHDWISRRMMMKMPWDTPSYGFVIMVPKSNGQWRVTVNPKGTNAATKRIELDGGYMPSSILTEAMRAGRCNIAIQLDCAEAFVTMKLGANAQRLSTFTSPVGKVRFLHGYFGWHSFPALFQRMIMEKVVLPTLDMVPLATILAWIDDLIVGATDFWTLLHAVLEVIDRLLALGGRLSLAKCNFLVEKFDWCGVDVDCENKQWRVARGRVASLNDTPIPTDREALSHVVNQLRFYFFGVADQLAQRARLGLLSELDVDGVVLARDWTERHTRAMREAFDAVVNGEWALCFDAKQPVTVTYDASGKHGYAVAAWQYDELSGKMRHISQFSVGWKGPQINWIAQVKECYAARQAACVIAPTHFPFATIILLGDNKNLSANVMSKDPRVVRWLHDIDSSGCVQRGWIPGEWNTIADFGSRSVRADENAKLTDEERIEMQLFALEEATGEAGATVVPGHLPIAPLAARIITAQAGVSSEETRSWTGGKFSTASIAGRTMVLYNNRLLIPKGETGLKELLLRMAHDDCAHFGAYERTLRALETQAKVHWVGIDEDVRRFVASCYKCQLAKAATHEKTPAGTLTPTVAPYVGHTVYIDLKGPMPYGTGYILVFVEAITRWVRLRYLPNNTAKEVCEELLEAFISDGTRPVVLRSDGGSPFDSTEYKAFCGEQGVTPVLGAAYHSQGQGLVESRIRGIAAAIMAVLGAKAPKTWFGGHLLAHLEDVINSTIVSSTGMSPYWAKFGRPPRTRLSASVDWSSPSFGEVAVGLPSATFDDVNNIIAAHHEAMDAAHNRALLATSVEQALTKRTYDASRATPNFTVGQWVLVHYAAPNRLMPWFQGPYQITSVRDDKNFVTARHFGTPTVDAGPFHVSRLKPFDMSRATREELTAFQIEDGNGVVIDVLGHRVLADGTYEFHIKWLSEQNLTSWLPSGGLRQVVRVINYCRAQGIPLPGTEPKVAAAAAGRLNSRGRGGPARAARGRGR